jgi:hypothetical protein
VSLFPAVYATLAAAPAVSAIVGTNIFRDRAEPVSGPYLVWSVLAGVPENNLSDPPPSDDYSIRIDCFARSESEVDTLALAVRNSVEAHGPIETIQSLGMEDDTGLWRIVIDVDWFHNRN